MFKPVEPQPNFATQEEAVLAFWQEKKIFKKSVEKNKGKQPYIIFDGPPTANAKPPLHTAVPMSFKDLAGRYQTMKGKYVPRQAGWDTHGLPVEVQVEKALGLTSKKDVLNLVPGDEKASIAKFNAICRESVWEFKKEWDQFVPRVGYWTDTENPYITYDSGYIEGVWATFKKIWDKQLVFKDYKVVPYCSRCGTGLSAAEVALEYQDVKDTSVFVTFPLTDDPSTAFLAWTTTPWTLPGNVGLAVGPEIEYVTVQQEKGRFILAKSRLEILKGEYEIVASCTGSELAGKTYRPLYPEVLEDAEGKKYEVVLADFVTTTDGTGIVHTAVMYGEDDFILGKKEGLARVHTVDLNGNFLPNVPEFTGMYVKDALVPILQSLTAKDRLYGKQTITHSYPHCWRCKTPLLYYAKDSWYIGMSRMRTKLTEYNSKVSWTPSHIQQGRFGDFIREARDWAVSRERFWGTPMPVWISPTGRMLCIGSFEELKSLAKDPSLISAEFDPHRPMVDDIILVKDGEEYIREPYVLDVWFDSGAMQYASGRAALGEVPADFIAEAVDQTRGWFYTLLAISSIVDEREAYKNVVCMGHLVDETGKKMSKSLGNVFNPWDTFKILGVDAIRWYLYTVNSPGEAKSFSIKEVQTSFRKTLLLYWNVFNYFVTYANVAEFDASSTYTESDLTVLDRWILSRQSAVITEVTTLLDAYDFMRAGRAIEEYVSDLSTWYLRRSRRRSDTTFFAVMYELLQTLSAILAPFTPFMTEHVYQTLRTDSMPESVHLLDWPVAKAQNEQVEKDMKTVRLVVEAGLSVRAEQKLKVRQPLAEAVVSGLEPIGNDLLDIVAEELNVLAVRMVETGAEDGFAWSDANKFGVAVGLDTRISDELQQAGDVRELLRLLQNVRKQTGLQPGQLAHLYVAPQHRSIVEPLILAVPGLLADSFLVVDETTWEANPEGEIELNGETIALSIRIPK